MRRYNEYTDSYSGEDDFDIVERNGIVFRRAKLSNPFRRYDPITLLVGTAATASAPATAGLIGAGGAITAGGLATFGMLAGAGVSAFGMLQQGQAAKQQGEFAAEMAERNAKIAEQNAQQVERRATVRAGIMDKEAARLQAQQNLFYGSSGVGLAGTGTTVIDASREASELDKRMMLMDEELRASAIRTGGANELAVGRAQEQAGRNAFTGSIFGASGTALSGLAQAGYMRSQLKPPSVSKPLSYSGPSKPYSSNFLQTRNLPGYKYF
jgi:hypothetical protein